MRNLTTTSRWKKSLLFVLGLSVMLPPSLIQARLYNNAIETEVLSPIVGAKKINPTTVEILFPNSHDTGLLRRKYLPCISGQLRKRDPGSSSKAGGADISQQSQKGGFKAGFGREYRFCFPHYRKDKSPAG